MKTPTAASPKPGQIYYGWVLVIAFTLVMAVAYGSNFSFSVFLKPMSEWFGWARATTSGPLAVALWASGLLAVLMGIMTDRYGPRIVVLLGGIAGVAGYLVISQTQTLGYLYAGFLITAINTSSVWTPLVATTARWFTRHRVLAIGLVTGGIGIGQMFMPPLANFLIETVGWRMAYVIIAGIIGVVTLPSSLIARRSPQEINLLPDGASAEPAPAANGGSTGTDSAVADWAFGEVMRTLPFWLLVGINMLLAVTLFMTGIHIAAYATDVGISSTTAAFALTFMGGANILAKVVAGSIAGRRGSIFTLLFFICLEIVALFAFAAARDYWMFFILAAVFGFGVGGAAPPMAALTAEFFGLKSVGLIMGLTGVGWSTGCALGTIMGDFIFDLTGSYVIAFILGGALSVAAGLAALALRHPVKEKAAT